MILLISHGTDGTTRAVERALARKGAPHFRIDLEDGAELRLSMRLGAGRSGGEITTALGSVPLDTVQAIWTSRLFGPDPRIVDDDVRRVEATVESLYFALRQRFWVNDWHNVTRGSSNKLFQLATAQNIGFTVPRTLVTNDDLEALDFFHLCDGKVAYVPMTDLPSTAAAGVFPARVRARDFRRSDLESIPCLFQEDVPKASRVRVVIIGRRIFAAETDDGVTPNRPARLPPCIGELSWALANRLGLVFASVDLARTPEGEYVFLSLDPEGYRFADEPADQPLADALTEMLIQGTPEFVARRVAPTQIWRARSPAGPRADTLRSGPFDAAMTGTRGSMETRFD